MHITAESQILTRGAQQKSLLPQDAPGTLLKSTQGNAVQGYCMPGTVSVYPRERETHTTALGAFQWIGGDPHIPSCASRG